MRDFVIDEIFPLSSEDISPKNIELVTMKVLYGHLVSYNLLFLHNMLLVLVAL